jgi:uncharacterized protein YodC (DUF2158 family)
MKDVTSDGVNICGWWVRRGCTALTFVLMVLCPRWRGKRDITIEYKEEEGTDPRTFTVKSPTPHRRESVMEWDRDMQGTFVIRKIPTLYRIWVTEKVDTSGLRSGSQILASKERNSWLTWACTETCDFYGYAQKMGTALKRFFLPVLPNPTVGVYRSWYVLLPAFQVTKSLYVTAIQVQTLNGLHVDRFVGCKWFNKENRKRCESLHDIE